MSMDNRNELIIQKRLAEDVGALQWWESTNKRNREQILEELKHIDSMGMQFTLELERLVTAHAKWVKEKSYINIKN